MILARVVGQVVSTIKHPVYTGKTVLSVVPVDPLDGATAIGGGFLACDTVQAGPGDLVLCSREGNTARQLLGGPEDPFHAVILAVVDEVVCQGERGETTVSGPGGSGR